MESQLKILLKNLLSEIRLLRVYIILSLTVIFLSYICYTIFSAPMMEDLGNEDGFFEDLTALCFLAVSIMFLRIFFYKKEIIFLIFFLVFLFGAGEEISWGQRILNFNTPEYFGKNNLQDEFNVHNLVVFNNNNPDYHKSGLSKLLSMNFQYKMFWLVYCFVLPLIYPFSRGIRLLVQKIRLPLPPFTIGILFVVSWLVFRVTLSFLLPSGKSLLYYESTVEISEFCSAFLFLILSYFFLKEKKAKPDQIPVFTEPNFAESK